MEFQALGDSMRVWQRADETILAANGFLHRGHGIIRRYQPVSKFLRQHRQVIQVIACRENMFRTDT